jgi:hypothetical protein
MIGGTLPSRADHEHAEEDRTSGRLGWLVDIARQVFSDREIISPGRYCAYNAFAGLILLAAAILMWVEPHLGSPRGGVVAAVAGMLLVSSVPVVLLRPAAVADQLTAASRCSPASPSAVR